MPILRRLSEFLDRSGVKYEVQNHPAAFTAQQVAQATHVKGRDVVKTVIIRDGEQFHMVVLSADHRVDLARLGQEMGLKNPRLATEEEFQRLFPGCETGAMPPFGNLFDVPVWVDAHLAEQHRGQRILCEAGTHNQAISLPYEDFERLVKPRVVHVGVHV